MMTKTDRLSFIRSRHAALFGVALTSLLPVSRAEIKDIAAQVVAATRDDESIIDEHVQGMSPSIIEEKVSAHAERETDILLSHKERAQLAREIAEMHAAQGVVPFVLPAAVQVEDDVPLAATG